MSADHFPEVIKLDVVLVNAAIGLKNPTLIVFVIVIVVIVIMSANDLKCGAIPT